MGAYWSDPSSIEPDKPVRFVVVPPILDVDREQRNRMAFSSYEWLCKKRELFYLDEQFLQAGSSAVLTLSPPSDRRLTVTAKLWERESSAEGAKAQLFKGVFAGGLGVRFQPDEKNPLSFIALHSNIRGKVRPQLSAAFVDPHTGFGSFGHAVLGQRGFSDIEAGLRYTAANMSAGVITNASRQRLDSVWFLIKRGPFTLGAQLEPQITAEQLQRDLGKSIARACSAECASVSVAYTPVEAASGDTHFSVLAEIERGSTLRVSVFQHYARVRHVYNLFEDDDVVGITNYLDLGLSVSSPLSDTLPISKESTSLQGAAAWQVNSNVMLKARVGTDKVAAAVVVKSWWNPSFTFAASAGWNLRTGWPSFGVVLNMDTDSELRYERGRQTAPVGSLVRQRRVAGESEIQADARVRPIIKDETDGKSVLPLDAVNDELGHLM